MRFDAMAAALGIVLLIILVAFILLIIWLPEILIGIAIAWIISAITNNYEKRHM